MVKILSLARDFRSVNKLGSCCSQYAINSLLSFPQRADKYCRYQRPSNKEIPSLSYSFRLHNPHDLIVVGDFVWIGAIFSAPCCTV